MGQAKLKALEHQARLKPGMPEPPPSMRRLPLDERGFPVPWFVAWLNEARTAELPPGEGRPDFRVIGSDRIPRAVRYELCWICGQRLERPPVACVIGPMCAVNRVSSEPPSHISCARFAAQACPFLTRPQMRRRKAGLEELQDDTPGVAIDRNPGVTLVWITNSVTFQSRVRLFDVGEPVAVEWYAHGRPATRDEVLASIETGLPALRAICDRDRDPAGAHDELGKRTDAAMQLLPAAGKL